MNPRTFFLLALFFLRATYPATVASAEDSTEAASDEYALVSVSVANLRGKPAYTAEMSTQVLLGTPLPIAERRKNWLLIETPEEYRCWVNREAVSVLNREEFNRWLAAPKILFLEQYGSCYEKPDSRSPKVADLVAGCIVRRTGSEGDYHEIRFPDGRPAFVRKEACRDWSEWLEQAEPSGERLVDTAKDFLGVPYLWGGTSPKMLDCSGLTKLCFFLNGVVIPRNSSQQAKVGEPVDITDGYARLEKGDLIFFGSVSDGSVGDGSVGEEGTSRKITHVGLYIENGDFIHEAGRVRFGSLNPKSRYYEKNLAARLVWATRLHHVPSQPGIKRVKDHPLYKIRGPQTRLPARIDLQ